MRLSDATDGDLLDREGELALLERALETASEGDGLVACVRGVAGVGKTALLREFVRRARVSGARTLSARGSELERELELGIARQLFAWPVASLDAELPEGAARLAVSVLDPSSTTPVSADGAHYGLFWLCSALAERQPLVLVVDDAHWADEPSLRWIAYLAKRLDGLRVLVVCAARPPEVESGPSCFPAIVAETGELLSLGCLSLEATAVMVRKAFPAAGERFCGACHAATGGNPFYLRELIASALGDRVPPTEDGAPAVMAHAPDTVRRSVLLRLGRAGDTAVELARAVAVLGDGAALRHAAALTALHPDQAELTADRLSRADILQPGRPLAFVHPIVRAAVYDDLALGARTVLHRRAARLLAEDGSAPDAVAVQLMASEPHGDAWAVEQLRAGAGAALARGAAAIAVSRLRRALAEPAPPAERPAVLLELGLAEARTQDPAAIEHLQAALPALADPRERTDAARALTRLLLSADRLADGRDVLERLLDELADSEPELAMALASDYVFLVRLDPTAPYSAAERAAYIRERLPATGQTTFRAASSHGERLLLVHLAVEETSRGRTAAEAAAIAERALDGCRLLAEEGPESPTWMVAVLALIFTERYDLAERALDAGLTRARAAGSPVGFADCLYLRAVVRYRRGDVLEAEADARASLAAPDEPLPRLIGMQVAALVDPLVEQGRLEEANELLAQHGLAGTIEPSANAGFTLAARARLRLAEVELESARDDFLAAGRIQERVGRTNPAIVAWRSGAARAHAALGEQREAERLADQELALARKFRAARALGVALGVRGLVDDSGRALDFLRDAVATLEGSPARLELARTLADLGSALRRANHRAEARTPLQRARELAHECGASALAEHAASELRATGARPRKLVLTGADALTASEARIARMAASGMTNRQIAQALFVTTKTVEGHLHAAYRKLDISSRADLPRALDSAGAADGREGLEPATSSA